MAKSRDIVSPRNSRNQTPTRKGLFQHVVCFSMATTLAFLALGSSGCCTRGGIGGACGFVDQIIVEQVNCLRDCVWSKRAFHMRFGHCERVHADHFKEGFCAGYENICDGGSGQCPALPPEKYWSFQYRTHEGAEMQNAWFAGYEAGAGAAKTDGAGDFFGVQVHRDLIKDMLAEEQIKNYHGGIQVDGNAGLAPVRDGSIDAISPQPNVPFANTPYAAGSMITSETMAPAATPLVPGTPVSAPPAPAASQPMPLRFMPAGIPATPQR